MGLLVFVTAFRLADLDPAPEREPALELDLTVDALPHARPIDLHLELRDNTIEGEWSRQEDYELVATHGRFSLALDRHFIVRNIGEAQAIASYTIEY